MALYKFRIIIIIIICSALNTLITITLQTYGALVGVHVTRQKNHRNRIGYVT